MSSACVFACLPGTPPVANGTPPRGIRQGRMALDRPIRPRDLVGDPRQLPPIGAGRPFVDLIAYLERDHGGKGVAELVRRRHVSGDAGTALRDLACADVQLADRVCYRRRHLAALGLATWSPGIGEAADDPHPMPRCAGAPRHEPREACTACYHPD